jgi:hypothetical protein
MLGPPHPTIDECKHSTSTTTSPTTTTSTSTTPTTTTDPKKSLKFLAVGGYDGHLLSDVERFNPFVAENKCKKPQPHPQEICDLCGAQQLFCGGCVMVFAFVFGYKRIKTFNIR